VANSLQGSWRSINTQQHFDLVQTGTSLTGTFAVNATFNGVLVASVPLAGTAASTAYPTDVTFVAIYAPQGNRWTFTGQTDAMGTSMSGTLVDGGDPSVPCMIDVFGTPCPTRPAPVATFVR
jgi:hypothetical protein